MTNTYHVHARCLRTFTSWLEVEADSPEEALTIAREEDSELIAAAEDSDSWPWDEYAIYDDEDTMLLHVLDDEARERNAVPELLVACTAALTRMADFYRDNFDSRMDNDPLVVQLRQALAQAGAEALPPPSPADGPIVAVSVHDGTVDVDASIPVTVVVEDWAVVDEDTGKRPARSVYGLARDLPVPKLVDLRRLIANW